jgi:hypothetical protein
MITVLCVQKKSIYKSIDGLDCWDQDRDAYNFTGRNPIIAHPPCAQWSRLHHFAFKNEREKNLAFFCFQLIQQNGGIFEHPAGTSFFKRVGVSSQVISIDQHWFGYPCKKRTYLYFNKCSPLSFPLNFEAYSRKFSDLSNLQRSRTTPALAKWLVSCIENSDMLKKRTP